MDLRVRNLLKCLNDQGYDAYIVGGYVRDYLLNISSNDYDICTNATPKILKKIFAGYLLKQQFGTIILYLEDLKVEITTYRHEIEYSNRHPIKYVFISNLYDDLQRRDFTINTLCLDYNYKLIDLLNGKNDLDNHLLRCVGSISQKIQDDPLRILRALRFSASLNFNIEDSLKKGIKAYGYLLKHLSYERKKEEIDKLITLKRLDIILEYGLDDYLELNLKVIKYYQTSFLTWYLIDKNNKYLFTKNEKKLVQKIKKIDIKNIKPYDLYCLGPKVSLLLSELTEQNLYDQYLSLPIKKRNDIVVKSKEILSLFDKNKVNIIFSIIEKNIINGKLQNNHHQIMSYLKELKHTIN